MSDSEKLLHGGEFTGPPRQIFPLSPGLVRDFMHPIQDDPVNLLNFISEARSHGNYSDVYTSLVDRSAYGLMDHHVTYGDFPSTASRYYRIALLYATEMAQKARSEMNALPRVDVDEHDLGTFRKTMDFMHYTTMNDHSHQGWERQKQRELTYTGTDLLTLAAACLSPKIEKMVASESKDDDSLELDASQATQAVHAGLVDGVLFINAYSAFKSGDKPKIPNESKQYIPTFDPAVHLKDSEYPPGTIYLGSAITLSLREPEDGVSRKQHRQFDNIDQILELSEQIAHEEPRVVNGLGIQVNDVITSGENKGQTRQVAVGGKITVKDVLAQVGPNKFVNVLEVQDVTKNRYNKNVVGIAGATALAAEVGFLALDEGAHQGFWVSTVLLGLIAASGLLYNEMNYREIRDRWQRRGITINKK